MTYYPRLPQSRSASVAASAEVSYWSESVPVDLARQSFSTRSDLKKEYESIPSMRTGVAHFDAGAKSAADEALASEQLRYSLAGRMGHLLEPVIKPLGYDWKMGIGLVGAFAAREVFVSTMAITYGAGSEDQTQPLSQAMQSDHYASGKPVWTPLVAISLLVWFVLAMQCMSTLAIVRRETGGWKWPLFMLAYMNVLAYVVALGVYQIGHLWFA
jgi:Fe2+ transport system protein B